MENRRHKTLVEQEAEDYVNSVMSSNSVSTRTPIQSGRKRSLSASAADTEVKKRKADNDTDANADVNGQFHQMAKARRSIFTEEPQCDKQKEQDDDVKASTSGVSPNTGRYGKGKQPLKSKRRGTDTQGKEVPAMNNTYEFDNDIKMILRKLSDDMQSMHQALNKKIDLIKARIESSEKRITDKVTDKVTNIIDKRVNTEASRLRKEIDEKIQNLKDDFNIELNEVHTGLSNRLNDKTTTDKGDDRYLRVVIRNLPESVNEVPKEKVDALIRNGLKIKEVTEEAAERKSSRVESKPGVVIAKFRNMENKKKVMTSKKALRDSRQYSDVFINHDQSREERNLATNMRTLLHGVKNGHNLQLRGSKIIATSNGNQREDEVRRGGHNYRRDDRWRRDRVRGSGDGRRVNNPTPEGQYSQRDGHMFSRRSFENRVGDSRNKTTSDRVGIR